MRRYRKLLLAVIPVAVTVGFVPGSVAPATATTSTHFDFAETGYATTTVTGFTCDNSGGPSITLGNSITLGG